MPTIPEVENEMRDDGWRAEEGDELAAWRASFQRQGRVLGEPCEGVIDHLVLREQEAERAAKLRWERLRARCTVLMVPLVFCAGFAVLAWFISRTKSSD